MTFHPAGEGITSYSRLTGHTVTKGVVFTTCILGLVPIFDVSCIAFWDRLYFSPNFLGLTDHCK